MDYWFTLQVRNINFKRAASEENIVEATNNAKTKDNSLIKAYLNELVMFVDGTCKDDLSSQEKLDILQIVCDIESIYSGNSRRNPIALKNLFVNDEVCTKGCFLIQTKKYI